MASRSKSSSSQSSDTTVTTTNAQVGATDSAMAVGQNARGNTLQDGLLNVSGRGNEITIQSLDGSTVELAFDAQKFLTQAGLEQFANALGFAGQVNDTSKDLALASLASTLTNSKVQADAIAKAQQSSNDIIARTNEMFVGSLTRNAGISETALEEAKMKNQLYIALGALAVLGIYLYNRK